MFPGVYLSVLNYIIDDSVFGNNDGIIDPGEIVEIEVTIRNKGDLVASVFSGTCSSLDPYITIISSDENFGTLNQNETSTGYFTIEADGETPAGYAALLNLSFTSNNVKIFI